MACYLDKHRDDFYPYLGEF